MNTNTDNVQADMKTTIVTLQLEVIVEDGKTDNQTHLDVHEALCRCVHENGIDAQEYLEGCITNIELTEG